MAEFGGKKANKAKNELTCNCVKVDPIPDTPCIMYKCDIRASPNGRVWSVCILCSLKEGPPLPSP